MPGRADVIIAATANKESLEYAPQSHQWSRQKTRRCGVLQKPGGRIWTEGRGEPIEAVRNVTSTEGHGCTDQGGRPFQS